MEQWRLVLILAAIVAVLYSCDSRAHDQTGKRPDLNPWFENLRSKKAKCCSNADGALVVDGDWEQLPPVCDKCHPRYKVKIANDWVDVPDEAVVTEPNQAGVAMVWGSQYWAQNTEKQRWEIRCFMPGSMY